VNLRIAPKLLSSSGVVALSEDLRQESERSHREGFTPRQRKPMKRSVRLFDFLSTQSLCSTIRLLFLLRLVCAEVICAQTFGGGIRGTITDPSGASVAGAFIMIEEVGAGLKWELVSSSAGLYSAHSLPVGKYSVWVDTPGFAAAKREGVAVEEGSERVVDVEFAVGQSNQTALVRSEDAALDSATSQVSVVNTGHVVRMNGRDWTTLACLQPGVAIVRTENTVALGNARGNRGLGLMMAIGGARPEQTSFELDGINITEYAGGGPASVLGLTLGVDAIEEFSIIMENVPAQYGGTSGGVIDATTRAGSNQLHGSLYEFLCNSVSTHETFSTAPPCRPSRETSSEQRRRTGSCGER
jgi:Carboxypeptidase regulatory-like domain